MLIKKNWKGAKCRANLEKYILEAGKENWLEWARLNKQSHVLEKHSQSSVLFQRLMSNKTNFIQASTKPAATKAKKKRNVAVK